MAGWGRSKRLPPGGQVPGEYCFGNRGEEMGKGGRFVERAQADQAMTGAGDIKIFSLFAC